MPRQRGTLIRSDFSKGLVTEASNLTFPENASTDELNFDITNKKTRRKRDGFDLESGHVVSTLANTPSDLTNAYYASGRWVAPGGEGNLEFASWQVGNKLYFFNTSRVPVQAESLTDTRTSTASPIDMDDFKSVGSSGLLEEGNPVTTATGNGFLFVAGADINPFYVKYDPETEEITSTEIIIKIRDTEGVDDDLDPSERPTTLTDEHHYNLLNQGWFIEDILEADGDKVAPLIDYENRNGFWPSNADVWWRGRGAAPDEPNRWENSAVLVDTAFTRSNTLAPRGHYILDAFRRDRQGESVSGFAVNSDFGQAGGLETLGAPSLDIEDFGPSRPTTVSFYAGRVWYTGQEGKLSSNVFFSQVLEGEEEIPKCYQKNDPTDEENSQILATDGGVLKIPEMARAIKLQPFGEWLLVFATNGVWAIGGIDGVFKADGFRVKKVASVNCLNPFTVVDARGIPFFWSDSGIYLISASEVDSSPLVQPVSEQSIQTFYEDEIPRLSRLYATGAYDSINNRIYWLYRSTTTGTGESNFEYDKLLILDLEQGAFLPWEVFAGTLLEGPHIAGVISLPTIGSELGTTGVVDGTDNVVDGTDEVVVKTLTLQAVSSTIKFLIKKNPIFRNVVASLSLSNFDFEEGDTSSWTVDGPSVLSTDPITTGIPKPDSWDTFYLFMGGPGTGGVVSLEREEDISSLDANLLADIDAGDGYFSFLFDHAGIQSPVGQEDTYDVRVQFKDSGGTLLDTLTIAETLVPDSEVIFDESLTGAVPANTRKVNMRIQTHINDATANADHWVDNISFSFSNAEVIDGEASTDLEVTFGDFRRTDDYRDFLTIFTNGKDYNAYMETGFEFGDEPIYMKTAPYIYSFIKQESAASLLLQGKWDYSAAVDSSKWTKKNQVYRDLKDDRETVVTRTKVRGRGRSLKLRWETEAGKPAELVGWATELERNEQS